MSRSHQDWDKWLHLGRVAVLAALVVLVALSLGGCLLFPRRQGSLPGISQGGSGRIDGTLTDNTGLGVAGVSVAIPELGQLTAISGVDGRFTLAGLTAGEYYVLLRKEGYLTGSYLAKVDSVTPSVLSAQLLPTSSYLHNSSGRVPDLCAECHVLHNPSSTDHLINGAAVNTPCFACHYQGANQGFDANVYRNSPHGPASIPQSNTKPAWTGQPDSDRGNCSTCHEPHGIQGPPFMLRKGFRAEDGSVSLNDLCFECHSAAGTGNTAGWPGKAAYLSASNKHSALVDNSLAGKYAAGDCGICHVPHGQTFDGSNYAPMTRAKGYLLCAKCHPGKASNHGGHGDCTICHDPHDTGSVAAPKVKNPVTGVRETVSKTGYRTDSVLPNEYCLACHKTPAPTGYATAKNPFAPTTNFKNAGPLFWQGDPNLHNVHVNRIWVAGYNSYTGRSHGVYHYGTSGDNNRVRCNQCHRVHQQKTGEPALPYNLGAKYISAVSRPYSGGIATAPKAGCSVAGNCHTCSWCHASPGNPTPSSTSNACYQCSWHTTPHSGVDY